MIQVAVSYGMFTDEGDQAIDCIVQSARENKWSWLETYQALCQLAEDYDRFGEAMDTAVREAVYTTLDYWRQDFYV